MHYENKKEKKDGEYYLFREPSAETPLVVGGSYQAKLLSIHCQDKLEAVETSNDAEITAINRDENGLKVVQPIT